MKLNFLESYKSVRKSWEINPKTRIVPKKKRKSRNEEKCHLKKEFNDEI